MNLGSCGKNAAGQSRQSPYSGVRSLAKLKRCHTEDVSNRQVGRPTVIQAGAAEHFLEAELFRESVARLVRLRHVELHLLAGDARHQAQNEALGDVGAFCKDGSLETFACGEEDIAHLSRAYTETYSKDRDTKRCYRNVICSADKDGCTAEPLKAATAIRATIDHDGCQYWLRLFCNLGGKR